MSISQPGFPRQVKDDLGDTIVVNALRHWPAVHILFVGNEAMRLTKSQSKALRKALKKAEKAL